MIKGSDLLVAALENEGVERIFGVPGEENLDVLESLRKSRIELVVTRHEQAAAFMAATHGRLTGRPGVCITTLGPGALNLTTGAAYAHLGATVPAMPARMQDRPRNAPGHAEAAGSPPSRTEAGRVPQNGIGGGERDDRPSRRVPR
jgi:glyoxylate carboligase